MKVLVCFLLFLATTFTVQAQCSSSKSTYNKKYSTTYSKPKTKIKAQTKAQVKAPSKANIPTQKKINSPKTQSAVFTTNSSSPTIALQPNGDFGNILVDEKGMALYFFTKDANGLSNCDGDCLGNWPAFFTPTVNLAKGLNARDFGVITRKDGSRQTTYKGWPLYYFAGDRTAGSINGEGLGNVWFVAKPNYTIMLANNQLTGLDGVKYRGDYTEGQEDVQYFVDAFGNTLYIFMNDEFNVNNYTSEDFSNNGAWPVFEADDIVVPSNLDRSLFGTIDVVGRKQLTYNGWPLYYFGQDKQQRGSNKGVSVPIAGVWPVAEADLNRP